MKCQRALALVIGSRDRELPVERELELTAHIESCEPCARAARAAQRLDELFAALPEPPEDRLDIERAIANVRARIAEPAPVRRRWPWVAVAASLALAALAALAIRNARGPAEPDRMLVDVAPSVLEGASTAELTPEPAPLTAPPPPAPFAAPDPLELERRDRARDVLRGELAAAASMLPPSASRAQVLAFAEIFEERTRELAGWPIARLVQGMAAEGEPDVARAAVRYLGVRGDRLALAALKRWLDDPALGGESVLALRDAGDAGLDGLVQALRDPRLTVAALASLEDSPDADALRALERGLAGFVPARADGALERVRSRLLAGVCERGPAAFDTLLALGRARHVERSVAVEALAALPDAGPRLAGLVRARDDDALVLEALACTGAPEAVEQLVQRCRNGRTEAREESVACLAAYRGPLGISALLELRVEGRIAEGELASAIALHLERDGGDLRRAAALQDGRGHAEELRELVELCVSSADRRAAPVLADLAAAVSLSSEDRGIALQAVAELGSRGEVPQLAEIFAGADRADRSERRLAAAALVAIQRLGGADAARAALALAPPRAADSVLAVLARASSETVSLVQVARALEPVLDARGAPENRITP